MIYNLSIQEEIIMSMKKWFKSHVMWFTCLTCILSSNVNPVFSGTSQITEKNWMNHPDIVTIRKIYNDVESGVKSKTLKSRKIKMSCKGSPFVNPVVYEDSSNNIKKYGFSIGSDDSNSSVSSYYDKSNNLRFMFEIVNSVNGTQREIRTYFDESGKTLYQDERLKKGPGWSGGYNTPILNPKEHINSLCN